MIKFCLAVRSHVFIIAGTSVILVMGVSIFAIVGGASTLDVATLCSLPVGLSRMTSMVLFNFIIEDQPLCVFTAWLVEVSSSFGSAFKCAVLLRFGTWQRCGNSLADLEIQ